MHAATTENVDLIVRHTYWWPYGESGLYRPLTTLTYLLNYAVLGNRDNPAGYHAFNALVHICNVLLVWLLVTCVTQDDRVSLAAAAIWAVLPVSVEAVTSIVGRADLLAAFGVLSGLAAYAAFRRVAGSRRVLPWIGLALATAVAVFSKESGVVIAPLVVCAELASWDRKTSAKTRAAGTAAVAAPLILMWSARSAVLANAPAAEFAFIDNPIAGASWIVGRLTALKTTGVYLWKLAWPATLSADYSFDAIPLARGTIQDCLAWATVAAALAAMLAASRRRRGAAFLAAFAVIAFVPASNLLFTTGTIFGERLLYLPSVAVVALAVMALSRLPRAAFAVVCLLIVGAFAARTSARNLDWTNDLTLWRAAVAAEPASAKAHHALAEALYDADPSHANIDAVIAEQDRAVAILESVPDEMNSFKSYRQAGAYYLDKAAALKAEGRPADERALTMLLRAKAIYTAGAKRYGTGNAGAEADLDRLLAAAYLGVHDAGRALDAANRARDLDPLAPLAYRLAATAQLAREDADGAAITLMAGSIVTADRGLTQALLGLYAAGLDEDRCAATAGASGPTLNTGCPIVRQHMCGAAPEAARLDRQLGRFTEAERVASAAKSMAGCKEIP